MLSIDFPIIASPIAIIVNGHRDGLYRLKKHWYSYQKIIVCDGAWMDIKHHCSALMDDALFGDELFDESLNDRLIILGDGDSLITEHRPPTFIHDTDQHTTDFEKALRWILNSQQYQHTAKNHRKNIEEKQKHEKQATKITQLEVTEIEGGNKQQKTNIDTVNTVNVNMDVHVEISIPVEIDIYWANGGDLDHTLGNMALASKYAQYMTCHFFTDSQYYRFVHSAIATSLSITGAKDKTISIFPFAECHIEHTQGLKYPMTDYTMQVDTQQSLRNCVVSDTTNIVASGAYFVFVES